MWTQIAHASTILVGLEVYYSFMGTNIEDFLRAVVRIIERIFVYEIYENHNRWLAEQGHHHFVQVDLAVLRSS